MSRRRLVGLLLGAALATPALASAQQRRQPTYELTLERALELARTQGPALAAARARVTEAGGSVEAASVRPFNPQVAGSGGPRFAGDDTTADWSVGVTQWLEIGGQRGHRLAAARAAVDAAQARRADTERLLLQEVAREFVQLLYWERRIALAQENVRIAEEIERVAQRRHEVGDVGGLEQSVASLALARARTDEARARAALGQVEGRLKILLGFAPGSQIVARGDLRLVARGDLRRLGMASSPGPTDATGRSDVRVLQAEIRQAESEADLGRAARLPNLALGASYSREEQANIVQGGLTVALPIFDHGQGRTAVVQTRRARMEAELESTRRRAAIEIGTASATSRQLSAALRGFEDGGLATLERAERVAAASYEAGAIPLGELLAVRRELMAAKLDYTDLLLGAATARIELIAAREAWR
jgi:outer membrane protein, heavy metal efflux system